MRRIYNAAFNAETLTTNPTDLFTLEASADSRVRVRGVNLGQQSTSPDDLRQLHVQLLRGATDAPSTSPITPTHVAGWSNAPAADSDVSGPSTDLASTTSASLLYADAFDEAGWCYKPHEHEQPILDVSQRLHVRVSAPESSMSLSGTLTFEEIGKIPL